MGLNLVSGWRVLLCPALGILLCLSTWASMAHAEVFSAVVGKERLTLTCDGALVVDTPCRLEVGASTPVAVQFAAGGTEYRYPHLLKRGLEKVLEKGPHPRRPADSEIALLRGLDLRKCHPAVRSGSLSGDIVQLCVSEDPSRVVLFMRGLCDRCDFEPVVLRK